MLLPIRYYSVGTLLFAKIDINIVATSKSIRVLVPTIYPISKKFSPFAGARPCHEITFISIMNVDPVVFPSGLYTFFFYFARQRVSSKNESTHCLEYEDVYILYVQKSLCRIVQ